MTLFSSLGVRAFKVSSVSISHHRILTRKLLPKIFKSSSRKFFALIKTLNHNVLKRLQTNPSKHAVKLLRKATVEISDHNRATLKFFLIWRGFLALFKILGAMFPQQSLENSIMHRRSHYMVGFPLILSLRNMSNWVYKWPENKGANDRLTPVRILLAKRKYNFK